MCIIQDIDSICNPFRGEVKFESETIHHAAFDTVSSQVLEECCDFTTERKNDQKKVTRPGKAILTQ